MDIKKNLLDILICPICKGKLKFVSSSKELICKLDRLAYPIKEGIPIMLEEEARILSLEEVEEI